MAHFEEAQVAAERAGLAIDRSGAELDALDERAAELGLADKPAAAATDDRAELRTAARASEAAERDNVARDAAKARERSGAKERAR